MALIVCRECGNQISNQAATCPRCGYKFIKKNSSLSVIAFIMSFFGCLSFIAIILAFIDLIFANRDEKHGLSGWALAISMISMFLSFGILLLL